MKGINYFFPWMLIFIISCVTENEITPNETSQSSQQTKHVIIVVIDGDRLIDTWGNNKQENIPYQRNLAKEGVFFSDFYNDGTTYTLSGHTAITTGKYEKIKNDGSEWPTNHSIFQAYLAQYDLAPKNCWLITSKTKLRALTNCKDLKWRSSYQPSINAEDREDSITLDIAINILETDKPALSLIHFRGPDFYGHKNDWNGYINSIKLTDSYVNELWNFLQADPIYKNSTALFITNDHGRHLNEISTGFVDHGDSCDGCRHIYLLALGPDFKAARSVTRHYGQVDIAPTIAKLLHFYWKGEGHTIKELVD